VRLADESDIEKLYDIFSHESVSHNLAFDPCSRAEFEEIFFELKSGGDLLVEEIGEEIVGVCKIIRKTGRLRHSVYIGSLAINYKYQNQGMGKKFFSNIIERLKKEDITRIELFVAADNNKAIKFFKSFGFIIEGTHKNFFSREGSDQLFAEYSMALIES
jgi:putative acetyltransferase